MTWVDGELWHGPWEGDDSELDGSIQRRRALERPVMPSGANVSGLETDGADLFYFCGGGTGKVRPCAVHAVREPERKHFGRHKNGRPTTRAWGNPRRYL